MHNEESIRHRPNQRLFYVRSSCVAIKNYCIYYESIQKLVCHTLFAEDDTYEKEQMSLKGINLYWIRILSLWVPQTGNNDNWFSCRPS